MKTTRRKLLIALVALQALFLLGLAGTNYATIWVGQEIKLRTIPIDPRDLLYGDYVILSYEANRVKKELWKGAEDNPERNTAVYTVLRRSGEYFEPIAVYPAKPEIGADEVVLKGKVDYSWEQEMVVRYGIERYYVPEGTGLELEKVADQLAVTVRVAPWGQNVITGVKLREE